MSSIDYSNAAIHSLLSQNKFQVSDPQLKAINSLTKKIETLEKSLKKAEDCSDKTLSLFKTAISVAFLVGGILGISLIGGAAGLALLAGGVLTFFSLNSYYERSLAKELSSADRKGTMGSGLTGFTAPIRQSFYRVSRLNKYILETTNERNASLVRLLVAALSSKAT